MFPISNAAESTITGLDPKGKGWTKQFDILMRFVYTNNKVG